MAVVMLDPGRLPPAERISVLRQALGSTLAPVELAKVDEARDFGFRGSFVRLGGLSLHSQRCGADPSFSAATVAAVHHVSRRRLYYVLAEAGVSLGDWVRARRLGAARAELGAAGSRWTTVAAVGRRRGFRDPTHFGRAFRSTYAMTPRDWQSSQEDARAREAARRADRVAAEADPAAGEQLR